jgi:hypothetical protein
MKLFIKRLLSAVLLLCFLTPFSGAQSWKRKRYETVLGFGPSQFFGDIGGFSKGSNAGGLKDMSIPQVRFDVNLNMKYRITQKINARVSLTYGYLHSNDSRGSNKERGFESSTSIFEPMFIGEYYFVKNKSENNYLFASGGRRTLSGLFESLSFYTFTGIGALNYSVIGNDKLVSAGMTSGGMTAVVPAGLGTTLEFSPDFNFGIEVSGRYSFSDNLDGYSSEYSTSNDVYYFLNFTITYKLNTGSSGLPSFR